MARGNDLGRDFDDQYNHSKRLGQARAARGEGPWAADKALADLRSTTGHTPQPGEAGHQPKHAKPNSDSCVTALGILGGLGWALTEAIRHLT
jgi:hypothetical protein